MITDCPRAVLFSNPSLEECFRRGVSSNMEVGGFLITKGWEPKMMSRRIHIPAVHKAVGCTWIDWIEAFLIIPNESQKPKIQWNAWDIPKIAEIARATAGAFDGHILHFHTHPHPNANPEPSRADIAFYASFFPIHRWGSEFCIVTPYPMRLHVYEHEWGGSGIPGRTIHDELHRMRYFSWRCGALRPFKEAI